MEINANALLGLHKRENLVSISIEYKDIFVINIREIHVLLIVQLAKSKLVQNIVP